MKLPLTIRASEADRVFSCHGSLLAAGQVPREDKGDGDEGAEIHFQIATRAVAELGATPPEEGLVAPKLPDGYKLPPFSAWIVDWALERIKELVPQDWSLMVELPIAYRYELPRPVWVPLSEIIGLIPADHEVKDGKVCIRYVILSGHMDIFAISPDGTQSIGIDWKSGIVGADPAESNWQAGTYLGLGKMGWEALINSRFYLAQPRIDEEATGVPRVSRATLEGDALNRINTALAEHVCLMLEDRYTTDSGPKQCRWCPLALSDRACLCPSLKGDEDFMKAQLTTAALAALKERPNDAQLGDFVLIGRTLAAPVKAATDLLHERLEAQGYVDAGCGHRITVKITKGDIEIPDKTAFRETVERILPERERQDRCVSWSKGALIEEIASARGLHKESKKEASAKDVWDTHLAPLVVQGERRTLVVT